MGKRAGGDIMTDRNKMKEKSNNTGTIHKQKTKGLSLKSNRAIAYTVLGMVTILCLFWFYVLFL